MYSLYRMCRVDSSLESVPLSPAEAGFPCEKDEHNRTAAWLGLCVTDAETRTHLVRDCTSRWLLLLLTPIILTLAAPGVVYNDQTTNAVLLCQTLCSFLFAGFVFRRAFVWKRPQSAGLGTLTLGPHISVVGTALLTHLRLPVIHEIGPIPSGIILGLSEAVSLAFTFIYPAMYLETLSSGLPFMDRSGSVLLVQLTFAGLWWIWAIGPGVLVQPNR